MYTRVGAGYHVFPEYPDKIQTNKQANMQSMHARRVDVNTNSTYNTFSLKLSYAQIGFQPSSTLSTGHGDLWVCLSKRDTSRSTPMFLHDQIRRVPQHYCIGIFVLSLSRTSALHGSIMHERGVVWQSSGQSGCCDWLENPQGWEQFQVYSALQTRNATDATKTRTQHVSSIHTVSQSSDGESKN